VHFLEDDFAVETNNLRNPVPAMEEQPQDDGEGGPVG
jgi:hypothetical protein